MAQEEPENRTWMAVVLLLLLVLAGAAGFWLVFNAPRAPAANRAEAARESANRAPRVKTGSSPEVNKAAPDEKPVETPTPGTKFELPSLTPFRKLVLEADTVEALYASKGAQTPPTLLAHITDTLEAIHSDFAAYAAKREKGDLSADDWAGLYDEAQRAFFDPETDTLSFNRLEAPRVNLWLRDAAKLPLGETVAPENAQVPWARRPHEGVNLESVTAWLEAIEAEYGATEFGKVLPLDIVIFADQSRYLEYARKRLGLNPPVWSAGFYTSGWDVICAPVLANTALSEVLRHEMFHAVQARLAPRSLLIPWFAEGTAEWLDKAPPKGNALATNEVFARAARSYLRYLVEQGYKLKLEEYLTLDLAAFYAEPELNYLIAYCFIDFLRSQPDLKPRYFEFWELLKKNVAPKDAFYASLGQIDVAELQRRFLAWLGEVPAESRPVKFVHDAPGDVKDIRWPSSLDGVPAAGKEGEIGSGWYQAIGKLSRAGFAGASAPAFIKGNYDMIVVACDNSESMGKPLDEASFDYDAFRRWLYSVRMAGSIKLTRKVEGSDRDEEVPPPILISLVEAVITNRVDEFTQATGISVGDELQTQIRTGYDEFYLTTDKMKAEPRRQLCLYTAESVAWYWGVRQDRANVLMIDFNTDTKLERENNAWGGSGIKSSSSPLVRLFAKTAPHISPLGSDGADTDWWRGLSAVTENSSDVSGKRAAILFFTDGPCSAGEFGHQESGRDEARYLADMTRLAERFGESWKNAGLDMGEASTLQIFALPHAENQGLNELLKSVPQARLDEWATRFKK